jgi:hypothetical protein
VKTKHIVQFSTGLGSAEVAWRLVEKYGPEAVLCLTADTRWEHEDNWRFGREVIDHLGCEWRVVADGRNPMEVGRDKKCVPSNRMPVCSQVLKIKLLREHLEAHHDPADSIIYIGFDWTEPERYVNSGRHWAPWTMRSPLLDPPYVPKPDLMRTFRDRGIDPPVLYKLGFPHANCSGGCVRGGLAQWELLYRVLPEVYRDRERAEQELRAYLGKDVTILRDRRGGTTTPLTLRSFRERIERGDAEQPGLFDPDDWGACGCFDVAAPTSTRSGSMDQSGLEEQS